MRRVESTKSHFNMQPTPRNFSKDSLSSLVPMDPRHRCKWAQEEDSILRYEVEAQRDTGIPINWTAISTKLPGRNNKDCRKRWFKTVDTYRKGSWNSDEDERLLNAISTYGTRWNQVAQQVGTRNADQCAKHWQHSLDPSIDRSPWTLQEDDALLKAVLELGRTWRLIASTKFPSRSPTDLKNRYELVCRRWQGRQSMAGETIGLDSTAAETSSNGHPYSQVLPEERFLRNNRDFVAASDFDDLSNFQAYDHGFDGHANYGPSPGTWMSDQANPNSGHTNPLDFPLGFPVTPESEVHSWWDMPPSDATSSGSQQPPTAPTTGPRPQDQHREDSSMLTYTLTLENVDPSAIGDIFDCLVERGLILDMRLHRQTR